MSVVLPAPSGPTRPRILPAGSVALMPSRARVVPKLFTSALTLAAGRVGSGAAGVVGTGVLISCADRGASTRRRGRSGDEYRDRHALTKDVVGVGRDHPDAIHQIVAHLLGLHGLGSEFSF